MKYKHSYCSRHKGRPSGIHKAVEMKKHGYRREREGVEDCGSFIINCSGEQNFQVSDGTSEQTSYKGETGDSFSLSYSASSMGDFADVPSDIICDILARLPIRTLVYFSTASKIWHDFITRNHSPLINLKLCWDLSNQQNNHCFMISSRYTRYARPGFVKDIYMIDKVKNWREKITTISLDGKLQGRQLHIAATCNGLLCLINPDKLSKPWIIYNPITCESAHLPRLNLDLSLRSSFHVLFGYNAENKKYKIVCVIKNFYTYANGKLVESCDAGFVPYVITLGETHCHWRELRFPSKTREISSSVHVEGTFYWYSALDDVIAMDISSEKFRHVKVDVNPLGRTEDIKGSGYIVGFGKNLGLVIDHRTATPCMQIWLLVDSNNGIWNLHSTNDMTLFENGLFSYKVTGGLDNNSFMVYCSTSQRVLRKEDIRWPGHLIVCTPETNQIGFGRPCMDHVSGISKQNVKVFPFMPSLVSCQSIM